MLRFYFSLTKPVIFLVLLVLTGSYGYFFLENWTIVDSIYMTVITITTVGFGEVHDLSQNGKIFTIFLVIGGVAFYGLAINVIFKMFFERNFRTIMDANRLNEEIKKLSGHYIICGGGRMALAMAEELFSNDVPFVIIENNPEAPIVKIHTDWLILNRDALLEETLIEAGIERSRGIASVLPTDADNLFVVLSARSLNPDIRIETRISHESSRSKMLQAGANKVVSPYLIGGLQMARSFIEPNVDEFLEIMMDKANYEFEMNVEVVTESTPNKDKKIRETDYRRNGFIIIGIKEPGGKFVFAPNPDTVLTIGYEILLMGKATEKEVKV